MAARILVIEDITSWSGQFEDILKGMGLEVKIVETHDQARPILSNSHYDLVLVDLCSNHPNFDLSCQRFFSFLNREHPNTAVIAVTGNEKVDVNDGWTLSLLGVSDFVQKAKLELPDFQRRIEDALRKIVTQTTSHVFISYRRDDSLWPTARLYDYLSEYFGASRVFRDTDTIGLGKNFVNVIENEVGGCNALLAVIGEKWLSIKDKDNHEQRRLDNPKDFVRWEIESALERNILVIPVLVDGVSMPSEEELPGKLKALSQLNALQISHNHFGEDVQKLILTLQEEFT